MSAEPDTQRYTARFFNSIQTGAERSAQEFVRILYPALRPASVLDVGCGRGVWLRVWGEAGVQDCLGLDGSYVALDELEVPANVFAACDLAQPFDLQRRFDLVQSLEVAEHLPPRSSRDFVQSLVRHGDVILFSAAVVGQAGVGHINERSMEFWRSLFREQGYAAFDVVRGLVRGNRAVQPWYRYNTILYANRNGQARIPAHFTDCRVADTTPLDEGGSVAWKMRRAIGARLPESAATWIANAKVGVMNAVAATRRSAKRR